MPRNLLGTKQMPTTNAGVSMCHTLNWRCLSLLLLLTEFNGLAWAATRARVSSVTTMTRNIEEEN
ncbi:maker109, partial [Drosophila busckii]